MAVDADISESKPKLPPSNAGAIPQFVVGQSYQRRSDIHLKYGGSWQNGVSSSAVCPAIFLFTGDTGEQYGYEDGFDDAGVFSYSGEGQVGDMQFLGGNRAIRDHAIDGRALHLFRSLGKGKANSYMGEFVLANHSIRRGVDRNGDERDVIVFHLFPVYTAVDVLGEVPTPINGESSLEAAKAKALAACNAEAGPAGKVAVQTLYDRSAAVRNYVLLRAGGTCESCDSVAPFTRRNGSPYLEVHHTTRLSDGGLDHPKHTAALCPTCHREIHLGQHGASRNAALQLKLIDGW